MAKQKKRRWVIFLLLVFIIVAASFYVYNKFFIGRVHLKDKSYTFIYIGREDKYEDVLDDINADNIISDPEAFDWLAKKMELPDHINPGRYRITNGMSMRQIINLIKYNKQENVKLTYNSQIRDMDEFVDYTDDKLELSDSELEDFIDDGENLHNYFGLDPETSFAMVVPGVYEVSWAISSEEFFALLKERYLKIWNSNRVALAKKTGYSVPQIITLASIVQSESVIESEQKKIAGVYFNRLSKGMPLQADPTLKFANKNYDAQRILDEDKETDSPYNTYRYKGLPPGPICLVGTQAIDATLNYSKHKYLFFCAKPQLNGYSDFSATYEEHDKYAKAYQKALNARGINR